MELNTYGDLKKVINAVSKQQKGEKIGQIALSTVIGVIPGAEAAKTTFDFIKAAFQKPDTKKTKTWLDKLDIDDEMSAIVDDTVENGFLQILAKTIENESDTKPLESDFNMNAKMVNYLKQTYSGRTISGIQENKMENKTLKNLIKEEIKKILQEDTPIESKPEVKKLITYLTNAGRMSLEQINTPQELDSLLNAVWSGMNDTMKRNSKAIAIKRIIDSKL